MPRITSHLGCPRKPLYANQKGWRHFAVKIHGQGIGRFGIKRPSINCFSISYSNQSAQGQWITVSSVVTFHREIFHLLNHSFFFFTIIPRIPIISAVTALNCFSLCVWADLLDRFIYSVNAFLSPSSSDQNRRRFTALSVLTMIWAIVGRFQNIAVFRKSSALVHY